jgi:hypothetical protein
MRLLINAVFAATVGYTLSVLINSSVSAATLVGFGIEVTIGDRFQMFRDRVAWACQYVPPHLCAAAHRRFLTGKSLCVQRTRVKD